MSTHFFIGIFAKELEIIGVATTVACKICILLAARRHWFVFSAIYNNYRKFCSFLTHFMTMPALYEQIKCVAKWNCRLFFQHFFFLSLFFMAICYCESMNTNTWITTFSGIGRLVDKQQKKNITSFTRKIETVIGIEGNWTKGFSFVRGCTTRKIDAHNISVQSSLIVWLQRQHNYFRNHSIMSSSEVGKVLFVCFVVLFIFFFRSSWESIVFL